MVKKHGDCTSRVWSTGVAYIGVHSRFSCEFAEPAFTDGSGPHASHPPHPPLHTRCSSPLYNYLSWACPSSSLVSISGKHQSDHPLILVNSNKSGLGGGFKRRQIDWISSVPLPPLPTLETSAHINQHQHFSGPDHVSLCKTLVGLSS